MTPDDVFNLVVTRTHTTQQMIAWAIFLLVVNLLVMLVVVVPAAVMFVWDKKARAGQYEQNKRILEMAEKHGGLTDERYKAKAKLIADEVRHILGLKEAVETVKADVKEVKHKATAVESVVRAMDERLPEFPSGTITLEAGGVHPVDPKNPPKRRVGD